MSYALGVEIGTRSTTATIAHVLPAPALGAPSLPASAAGDPVPERSWSMPSRVAIDRSGRVLTGARADSAPIEDILHGWIDRVGDPVPMVVGDSAGSFAIVAEELLAVVVGDVIATVSRQESAPPARVVVEVPTGWREGRVQLVRDAFDAAGLDGVVLRTSAVTVASDRIGGRGVEASRFVVVFDLGAVRLDVSVVRPALHSDPVVVSRESITGVAGDALDDLLLRHVVAAASDSFAAFDGSAPEAVKALETLRRECREARERLSRLTDVVVPVALPGRPGASVEISRAGFDELIADKLAAGVEAVRRVIAAAALEPADVLEILAVGGAASTPAVATALHEALDIPVTVPADPAGSAARSAALSAAASLPRGTATASTSAAVVVPLPTTVRGRSARAIKVGFGSVAAAFVAITGGAAASGAFDPNQTDDPSHLDVDGSAL